MTRSLEQVNSYLQRTRANMIVRNRENESRRWRGRFDVDSFDDGFDDGFNRRRWRGRWRWRW
jgi:hypothetical protein